jgi:hypothetical protein
VQNRVFAFIALFAWSIAGAARSPAQSMDDLNLQVHGYATQGFIYSNQNSWDTTDSENGSAAWTEAVVNLSVQPQPKLRIGVQARYFLLGDYGNQIVLDWAQADYKVNEHFGFRAGDVKTPIGLLNESQDIDPAHLWVLLPQSIYPIASRNSLLDHYGGVVYGAIPLGEHGGKLEYRGFGGERSIGPNDAYFAILRSEGISVPNGITGKTFGGTLHWNLPISGLMTGVSEESGATAGEIAAGTLQGTVGAPQFRQLFYFGKYERNKLMIAGEYSRLLTQAFYQFTGTPAIYVPNDERPFYAMASYKLTRKLTGGVYYSSFIDRKAAFTGARYQKDWALAARYDFNPYMYCKAEQHFIDGTAVGFSPADNPNLVPVTRMTMIKLGVSF